MPRLDVVPCIGVTLGGLPEQDVVAVGQQFGAVDALDREPHRCQPQRERGQHQRGPPPRAQAPGLVPGFIKAAAPDGQRDQHQCREKPDALGHDAQCHRYPTGGIPGPGGTGQKVADQPIAAERDPEAQHRIDLRALGLQQELRREHEDQHGRARDVFAPQAAPQVEHQPQRPQSRQRTGQQKRDLQLSGQLIEEGDQPHEDRRLVRIEFAAPRGKQPLARFHHFACDLGKARLIGWPGRAQPDAREQRNERQPDEPRPPAWGLLKVAGVRAWHAFVPGCAADAA